MDHLAFLKGMEKKGNAAFDQGDYQLTSTLLKEAAIGFGEMQQFFRAGRCCKKAGDAYQREGYASLAMMSYKQARVAYERDGSRTYARDVYILDTTLIYIFC